MDAAQPGHDALKDIEQLARDVGEAGRASPADRRQTLLDLERRLNGIFADEHGGQVVLKFADGAVVDVPAVQAEARDRMKEARQ